MGDDNVDGVENDDVQPLTVEEALNKARSESVFTGHPASGDEEEKAAPETDDKGESEKDTDQDQKDDAQDEPDQDQKDEDSEPPVKRKYSSHDEAEKGAKEAERRMHEAIEEARRMRSEVEEIRKQIQTASQSETITKQEKKELDIYFKEMLSKIKDLDPDDPEYDAQLAKEWAGSIKKSVGDLLSEESQKREAARKQEEETRRANEEVGKQIIATATKAGLDMSSEKSPDYNLFWAMSQNAVGETVEDRINWTIDQVNTLKTSIVGKTIESKEKAKQAQTKNKVLERGVSHTTVTKSDEEVRPLTIMEALAKSERRL